MPPLRRRRLPTTPRLQRATTTMPGRGQAPIAAAPIRPGPRARHPRKRQPKYPNADCPRRPHLNAQEPSLSGDSPAPAPAAPPPRPRASTSLVVLAPLAIGYTLWAAQGRSEERRVGKEWVGTCRTRWAPSRSKKKAEIDCEMTARTNILHTLLI